MSGPRADAGRVAGAVVAGRVVETVAVPDGSVTGPPAGAAGAAGAVAGVTEDLTETPTAAGGDAAGCSVGRVVWPRHGNAAPASQVIASGRSEGIPKRRERGVRVI